jgi:hypothetical protein
MTLMNISLLSISLLLMLVLIFAVFRFVFRERYARGFSQMPGASRDRLLQADRRLMVVFKVLLWLSPLYVIVIPLLLFYVERDSFLAVTICMVLLVITVLQEYLFRKWLANYMNSLEAAN